MGQMEEEVRMTPTNFDSQLQSYIDALVSKYGNKEFHKSNLLFKPYDPTEKVYSFDTKDFFHISQLYDSKILGQASLYYLSAIKVTKVSTFVVRAQCMVDVDHF